MGIVFSTNRDYKFDEPASDARATLPPSGQELRVWLDRKHRAGKQVTLVRGFVGTDDDLQTLARELKNKCGVGGTAKDGEIVIQGDHRDRVTDILLKAGYKAKKAGG
jgi:translation initiation factor 1